MYQVGDRVRCKYADDRVVTGVIMFILRAHTPAPEWMMREVYYKIDTDTGYEDARRPRKWARYVITKDSGGFTVISAPAAVHRLAHYTLTRPTPKTGHEGEEHVQPLEGFRVTVSGSSDDLQQMLSDIRAKGWTVGVHNDYHCGGKSYTFWLFTKGRWAVKGEGATDIEALKQVMEQI